MSRKRIGRPSKLTPEVKKRLIDAIKAGNYIEPACRFAGIAPATFYRWMERGARASSGEFREFWEELTRAEAEAEARMVAQWQAQIPQDWRAARDFLARKLKGSARSLMTSSCGGRFRSSGRGSVIRCLPFS